MKNKIIYLFLISLVLTGCFEEAPKEEVHTVDWFLEHQDVMNTTLEKCSNNPGELLQTPNCINALEANNTIEDRQYKAGKFVKSSGIGW
ncbi:MAG TPA: hypothetical protein ENJ60_10650 [Aeromonadales bacterium]|nr:hypothetical protein [Aeromonadales bacterium]